jgi:hypothetical protein
LIDGECQPVCDEDEELIDGKCVPIPIYCPAHAGGCETPCDEGFVREGDECVPIQDPCEGGPPCPPVDPELEPIECSEGEELVDVQCVSLDTNPVEPNDLVTIGDEDDNSDDQSIIGEGDPDESENEEQDEDESGESEDEAEDQGAEQESEGESEEESEGGN